MVKTYFRFEMELMRNEVIRAIAGLLRGVGTKDGYEEAGEDFEIIGSSGKDRDDCMEISMDDEASQLDRYDTQLKLKHKMDVSNFLCTLNPKHMIDWIGKLEDYFELENIGDSLRVRLKQTKLEGHSSLQWKELQREREEEGKQKITRWRLMVTKLKAMFILADYELDLFKR